ncbi:protein FAR1-RELATED SEQUENCE 5-like [Fagus crenata]
MAGIAGIHEFLDSDGGFDDEIVENSGECEATEDGLLQRCNLNNVENDHMSLIEPSKEGLSVGSLEPCIGMTFSSLDGARDFYYDYAKRMGFTIRTNRIRHSLKNMAIIGRDYVCSREGFRAAKHTLRKDRVLPSRPITREGCKAMTRLAARDGAKFRTYFQEEKDKKIQDLYDELQHERERSATF